MFDADGTGAENVSVHPYTVRPNDYATQGVWLEQEIRSRFDYIKVSDVKAYNVDGGTFTQDAWRTRDINTEDSDDSGICSIASNQITLEAGTYICSIACPSYRVNESVVRLYNITDSAVEILGLSTRSSKDYFGFSRSLMCGKFTIASQKVFEVQHYCTSTLATSGLGTKSNISGVGSVYTVAEFWRLS